MLCAIEERSEYELDITEVSRKKCLGFTDKRRPWSELKFAAKGSSSCDSCLALFVMICST